MCINSEDSKSKFGLDSHRTAVEKLFRMIVSLVLAGFFGIFTVLVHGLLMEQWARIAVGNLLEVCWVFWLFALVFVWWKPRWLRAYYLSAERKMYFLASALKYAVVVLIVFAVGFVAYLIHIGVLPPQAK